MSIPTNTSIPASDMLLDSLKLAVVGFGISLSMCKALDPGYTGTQKATRELMADVRL